MRVKVYLNLKLDPEEYPMPADENPTEDIESAFIDLVHEIEGVEVKHIKVTTE